MPDHVVNGGRREGLLVAALAVAGVAWFVLRQQIQTGEVWGVPVDDSYIHFRFAQNLAAGHDFAFNPGQPLPGSTSPLWVLLLAAGSWCGLPLWLAAKVYGTLCLLGAVVAIRRLGLRLTGAPGVGLLAAVLTALDGRLLWAAPSGMEVTLFAGLCLLAFLTHAERDARPERPPDPPHRSRRGREMPRGWSLALVCGLATLARPEGFLLAAILGADAAARRRPSAGACVRAAAIYGILVVPYIVFALVTTGRPLPTTFYAKASALPGGAGAALAQAQAYLLHLLGIVAATNPLVVVCAPVGAVILWRAGGAARAAVVWPVALILEQALVSPYLYHFGRYVMPLEPFFALWSAVGALALAGLIDAGFPLRRRFVAGAVLALAGLVMVPAWADRYALAVGNIDAMQVRIAGWVGDHTPRGVPVATNDIGAIGYVSAHPTVDIVGLVTPRFVALGRLNPPGRRAPAVYAAVRASGARYLIIFPAAYPELAAQPGLRPVLTVTVRPNVIEASDSMVVYRLPGMAR